MKKYSFKDHPEDKKQLSVWKDKWIANAMSIKQMDEEEKKIVKEAIKGLYKSANLPVPPDERIIFVPSPFIMRFAGGFAAAIWYMRKNNKTATEDAIETATLAATLTATLDATWGATRGATRAATRGAIEAATWDATEAATLTATRGAIEAATWDATLAATLTATWDATLTATRGATLAATRGATWDATEAATLDATWDATLAAIENKKSIVNKVANWFSLNVKIMIDLSNEIGVGKFGLDCAKKAYNMWDGGNQWSGAPSYLTFFRYVAKLKLDYSKWQHYEDLSIHSGPRIMHEKFCIISDRPEILTVDSQNRPHNDNGPFCKWRDGTALYSYHGVRVPGWIIEEPETITLGDIEKEDNAEIRRVMLIKFGMERYLNERGAEEIDRDRDTKGERILFKITDKMGDIKLIKLENSTPEKDGSTKYYTFRVKPEVKTCQEAVAYLYSRDPKQYKPTIES